MRRRSIAIFVATVAGVAGACSSGGAPSRAAPGSPSSTTPSAGCVSSLATGTHRFGGATPARTYRVALPPSGGARHPLLVVVHGFASSAAQFDRETNFERAGTKRGYVVLSPDALGSPTNWNLFATLSQPDDYAFVGALVGSVIRRACVDPTRVFIAGHSAGSAFSGFLVCRTPYRFAAIAMVSATVPVTCPHGVMPAVISVHGTADPAVPYAGGLGICQTVPMPPVRTTMAQLAKDRKCAASPTETRVAGNVLRMRYRGCAKGDDVELFTIERGGHLWSAGTTTRILDFFDVHQRP